MSCTNLNYVSLDAKKVAYPYAFYVGSLKKLVIGTNVEVIDNASFYGCGNLTDVTLYSEKVELNNSIFEACKSLANVKVNEENNSFKSVDGVVYSKDGNIIYMYPPAKEGDTYIIPSEVKKIGGSSFQGNKYLKEIDIPDTVEEVSAGAFFICDNLEYVKLNARKVSSSYAFYTNALKKIDIGENVEIIGGYTFYKCKKLTSINYLGTIESWNKVSKQDKWNLESSITEIICTDGTVTL